jgi:hypothetical protein
MFSSRFADFFASSGESRGGGERSALVTGNRRDFSKSLGINVWREGGIRTPDSLATMSDFETGLPYIVINHLEDGWLLSALVGIVFLS